MCIDVTNTYWDRKILIRKIEFCDIISVITQFSNNLMINLM